MYLTIPETGILLRPLEPDDAPALVRHANDRQIWDRLRNYFPHPYTLEDATAFIAAHAERKPPSQLAIVSGQEAIGVIGFFMLEDVYAAGADFGYWIGRSYWGKGILSSVIKPVTDYIFQNFPVVRLQAGVFAFNTASARVLEKNGFMLESVARQAILKNGKLTDELRYVLLKTDTGHYMTSKAGN